MAAVLTEPSPVADIFVGSHRDFKLLIGGRVAILLI